MIHSKGGNGFEFVAIAILRAKQLMRGCLPRVPGMYKATKMAQLEVAAGKVVRLANTVPILKPVLSETPAGPIES